MSVSYAHTPRERTAANGAGSRETHPPKPLADTMMPFAKESLVVNHEDGTARLGTARQPMPTPTQTPWDRTKCQYCVDSPWVMVPTNIRSDPPRRRCLKLPLSNIGPARNPKNTIKKLWTAPIDDTWNALLVFRRDLS